jgi:thiamine biosynthesis protein ThiI
MAAILVRFSELGLKSERVRSRFLSQLADDIQDSLIEAGIEHIMDVKRSRIFIETDSLDGAVKVLKLVPGIYSFSIVEKASAERGDLMRSLSTFGSSRIKRGMTYGLKVRRSGNHPYTSHDIAVEGGGAVISHLDEGTVKVDLKDPDIWIEVEIRDSLAYIFDSRVKGMGGMPASSQGRTILYLPRFPDDGDRREMVERVELSSLLMRRRGCKVIPACRIEDEDPWMNAFEDSGFIMKKGPFLLDQGDLVPSLLSAAVKLKAWGVIFPFASEMLGDYPVLHSDGSPIAQFYPTASMGPTEIRDWLNRLRG